MIQFPRNQLYVILFNQQSAQFSIFLVGHFELPQILRACIFLMFFFMTKVYSTYAVYLHTWL